MQIYQVVKPSPKNKLSKANWKFSKPLLLLLLPCVLYFILFYYLPMIGVVVAFQDFKPGYGLKGYFISPFVGFDNFIRFFNSPFFGRLITNTFVLGFYSLVIGFPLPIILALLLNEVRHKHFKKLVQTVSYLPYFVSTVIIVGMLYNFFDPTDGIVNTVLIRLGLIDKGINFLFEKEWFRFLYIGSNIWQFTGFSSIIYLAALSGVDQSLYEAAEIDGANRMQRIFKISIPSIMPTIGVLFVIACGSIMNVSFDKILIMYNQATYATADVLQTYVFRMGIQNPEISYSSAIGLFNSILNFGLMLLANGLLIKRSDISLI